MTNTYVRTIILILIALSLNAQGIAQLKSKKALTYRFRNATDSIPKLTREWQYDEKGRLVFRQYFTYSMRSNDPAGTLYKEEHARFDSSTNTLNQTITRYKQGKSTSEKVVTKYLIYAAKEKDCKPLLQQRLDNYMEIVKEDTLTYDEKGKLINRCVFNYKGSTFLFCDTYKYNRKGWKTAWKTFNRWTTIGISGKVKQKNSPYRRYRYFYNAKGQHIRSRGKYNKKKYHQKKEYDHQGRLTFFQTTEHRRAKYPSKMQEKTGKKYYKNIDQITEKFENGYRVYYQEIKNSNELNRTEKVYEGNLEKGYTMWYKGKKWEEVDYSYDSEGIRTAKELQKYNKEGQLQYREISSYNATGQIIETLRTANKKELRRVRFEYDADGKLLSKTILVYNNVKFEKTVYIYTYY